MSRKPLEEVSCDRCNAAAVLSESDSKARGSWARMIVQTFTGTSLIGRPEEPTDLCETCLAELGAWYHRRGEET